MLYDAVIVAMCHFTFIKTIRIIKQRVSPDVKFRLELIIIYQYWFINCIEYTTSMQHVNKRGKHAGLEKEYMETLYFLFNFYKPKTALRKSIN